VLIALGAGSGTLAEQAENIGVRLAATHVHTERAWIEAIAGLAADPAHRAVEDGHTTGKIVLRTSALTGE
jgi:hypothetical protein